MQKHNPNVLNQTQLLNSLNSFPLVSPVNRSLLDLGLNFRVTMADDLATPTASGTVESTVPYVPAQVPNHALHQERKLRIIKLTIM